MSTFEWVAWIALLVFMVILLPVCTYYLGYVRGAKFVAPPKPDPTPAAFQAVAEIVPDVVLEQVGYLEPLTGPIITMVIEEPPDEKLIMAEDYIAELKHELHKKEKLRARYYRLLQAERDKWRGIDRRHANKAILK